jgi:mannose-6-phosphate isomerase-like protein (cupin superfamily)
MINLQKINLHDKFDTIKETWKPVIVGELNNQHVKIVKIKGEFPWHFHEKEDELFYVINGNLHIRTVSEEFILHKDEFIIIPRGMEHSPSAVEEVLVMLFEPKSTLNTGNVQNEFTHSDLQSI